MDTDFAVQEPFEARTGLGQPLRVSGRSGARQQILDFLKTHVASVDLAAKTHATNIGHGAYGMYSRYRIKQHDYAGGGPGESGAWSYIELLEIAGAPAGRSPFVINRRTSWDYGWFFEWESLDAARAAYKKIWGRQEPQEKVQELPGLLRVVKCGLLTPWFYAVGSEELVGDFALPYGLEDDPTYRIGRQFVVYDWSDVPSVKTCMGTRFVTETENDYRHSKKIRYRLVCFDDGSIWNEHSGKNPPRLLEAGELWITEAVEQFRQFLAGKHRQFEIRLTDGRTFVGKLSNKKGSPCTEGRYNLSVKIKGEEKLREGWVDFTPTPEHPDVVQFVTSQLQKKGAVERVEVKEAVPTKGGKKWAGAYYAPST